MKSTFSVGLGWAAAVMALLSAGSLAHADGPVVTPPKLAHFVDAVDPRPSGPALRATVELELDIDKAGAIVDARVTRSASVELDDAALGAAKAFVFEPATRDGIAVSSRIRYEYVFAARATESPPVAPEVEAARPAAVAGLVRDRESGKPIAGADVVVTTDSGPAYRTKTDATGIFRIEALVPGPAHVVVTAEGHVPERLDETLDAGTITEATLRLEATPDPEAFVATARVEAPPREVTKRTLTREEMTRLPGTRGDPIRAVELLPGVGRPSVGAGNPILRGANLADSQVFAEGAPVPILFHFGGLSSFAHGRVLDTVDVYPSNFSVRYGRKVGGVIDVRFRDPRTDRLHGIADISLLESSLLVETPVGDKFAVLAAARRSNIDAVLNSAADSTDLAIKTAPVYFDYQALATYRPTDADRIRLLSFGSIDRFALVFKTPAEGDPSVRGQLVQNLAFHNVQLGWRHRSQGGSEHTTEITYGRTDSREGFGALASGRFGIHTLQGRSEFAAVLSPAVRIVGGLDLLANHFTGSYEGIAQPADEGANPMTLATQRHVAVTAETWVLQPAAYVEAGLRPTPRLLITPGVRADYNDFVARGSIDPRLSTRWDVTDATALKAGVGRFTQHPQESRVAEPIGNPNLGFTHSTHLSAGAEQKVGESFSVGVEGFAKWIDGIVATTPGGRAPFYYNSQDGRIFGGELLARYKPSGRFFGFVSYTLMRSERRDAGDGQEWRLFDRDTPHMLSAAAVYRLGRGWEVGAAFRYTSGAPYTPVVGSSYEAGNDVYLPRFGAPMSARNPAFSRLDLRVEKKWTFTHWNLAVYLDVQNALNSPNREGFNYSYDYSHRQGARGLPIFPALGIRGEL